MIQKVSVFPELKRIQLAFKLTVPGLPVSNLLDENEAYLHVTTAHYFATSDGKRSSPESSYPCWESRCPGQTQAHWLCLCALLELHDES